MVVISVYILIRGCRNGFTESLTPRVCDWTQPLRYTRVAIQGSPSHWGIRGSPSHWGIRGSLSHWGIRGSLSHCGIRGSLSHWGIGGSLSHWGIRGSPSHWGIRGIAHSLRYTRVAIRGSLKQGVDGKQLNELIYSVACPLHASSYHGCLYQCIG